MSFEEAATLSIDFLTVLYALRRLAHVQGDDRALVPSGFTDLGSRAFASASVGVIIPSRLWATWSSAIFRLRSLDYGKIIHPCQILQYFLALYATLPGAMALTLLSVSLQMAIWTMRTRGYLPLADDLSG